MFNLNDNIEEVLITYLREECLPRNSETVPGNDENLIEAGIVDSAGLISFIAFIEKKFDIAIADEDLLPENFISIASIARYIRARKDGHHE